MFGSIFVVWSVWIVFHSRLANVPKANHFLKLGISKHIATVVTQVEVDADDPAFLKPSKPIGSFMDEAQAMTRRDAEGWEVTEDAGRGWRRVVASPKPMRIVEEPSVKQLISAGIVVVTVGGRGIPVPTWP